VICQACGIEAPTRRVEFHQNIGALVMRFHQTIKGDLCKSCVHRKFWKVTLVNLTLGWWGVISLLMTPIFIVMNIVRYGSCLGMPPVPPRAARPVLTDELIAAMRPHAGQLIERLKAGEDLGKIATDIAGASGATPGQALLYLRTLIQTAKRNALQQANPPPAGNL
jgi:hypothetical protein